MPASRLSVLIKEFLESRDLQGNSFYTIRNYRQYLTYFRDWSAIADPLEIDFDLVLNYKRHLKVKDNGKGAPLSKSTQSYYLIALVMFLDYLRRVRNLDTLEPSRIDIPKPDNPTVRTIETEHVRSILAAPYRRIGVKGYSALSAARDAAMMALMWDTGLRVSEVAGMNRSDVKPKISRKTKGDNNRFVRISAPVLQLLDKYLKQRGDQFVPLFLNHHDRPKPGDPLGLKLRLNVRTMQRAVKMHAAAAGIDDITGITPHAFRHAFATDLLDNGADITDIQKALGHTNILTTTRYLHVRDSKLEKTIATYHSDLFAAKQAAIIHRPERVSYTVSSTAVDLSIN